MKSKQIKFYSSQPTKKIKWKKHRKRKGKQGTDGTNRKQICDRFKPNKHHMIIFFLLQSKLPQTQQLKATHIYYLTASVGQEYRHSLTGSSA